MSINLSVSSMLNQLASTGSYSYTTSKTTRIVDEDKYNAKESSTSLYTSLRNLRKTDIASVGGKLKAKKYIKNVLNAYNDLKNNSVTTSKTSKRAMSKLSKIFEEYSSELEDIGITKSNSGKYSFDTIKWDSIDDDKLATAFEKIFGKESDFSKGIEKYNKSVKSAASENLIQTKTIKYNNSVTINNDKIGMAGSANNLNSYIASLTSSQNSDDAVTYMNELINNFNNIFTKEKNAGSKSEYLDALSSLISDNKSNLNAMGLDADDDGTSIRYYGNDDSIFKSKYEEAKSLFSGDFGNNLSSLCKDLLCDLLETKSNGIQIDEYL